MHLRYRYVFINFYTYAFEVTFLWVKKKCNSSFYPGGKIEICFKFCIVSFIWRNRGASCIPVSRTMSCRGLVCVYLNLCSVTKANKVVNTNTSHVLKEIEEQLKLFVVAQIPKSNSNTMYLP